MSEERIRALTAALEAETCRADAYARELEEKERTIRGQQLAIAELGTPVIQVWDRVLCLPVAGLMDTTRSAEMTQALLRAVVERKARCCIIDVTGIEVMDTGTADHFMRMARAVGLLGAECVITGVRPRIARTVVQMGVDLRGLRTHRTLRDALERYVAEQQAAPTNVDEAASAR